MLENKNTTAKVISKEIGRHSETLILIFIVLKVTNNVGWSWWWVFSPFLFAVILAFLVSSFEKLLIFWLASR